MDGFSERRGTYIAACFLVVVTILVGLLFMGGQTSKVLSTVGAAVGNSVGNGGGATGEGSTGSGSDPAAGSGSGSGSGTGGQVADAAALVPTLLIVRTGELVIQVPVLDAALRDGDGAVIRAGGYISGSSRSDDAGRDSAEVTYRIPSAAWDETLDILRGLASTVVTEQVKTEEVSGQVVDLSARIANLRTTEAALQAIMAKAAKISDVLDVQAQLTDTRGEIERLVADKANLLDRASFGSLVVTYRLPIAPAPTKTPVPAKGWDPGDDVARASSKLVGIGQTTTSVGIWLAIVGLPVAIGGLVLLAVAWQLYRVGRWVIRRRETMLPES
jgi:outer membrane murein-binding lipoprotein Lpp